MSFPDVWMLVCDEFPDRTAAARAHMKDRGILPTYWRGIHGSTWGLETSLEYEPGERLPPGHVALNLGAYQMWQAAAMFASSPGRGCQLLNDPIIFFEDDVELPSDFRDQIRTLLAELDAANPDWDLVFIGLAEVEPQVWNKVTDRIGDPGSRLCRLNDPFGTHALMVRRRAIPVLLEHMRKAERNLDQQLFKYVLRPGLLNWCAVLPTIVRQRTFDYDQKGKPAWAPSTLRDGDGDKTIPAATELEGRPSQEVYERSLAIVAPYPCIYRGEPLFDHGTVVGGRATVPLNECALRNAPCHQRAADVVDAAGAPAFRCERCDYRLPMSSSSARPRLPIPEGHFNPSMAKWGDKLILATRDSWGHSKVALWELTNALPDWTGAWDCKPIGSYGSSHPQAPRLEDPRLFVAPHRETHEARLHAAFNMPDGYPPKLVQVGYACFAADLSGIEYTEVMPSPHGNAYEKNWSPVVEWEENEIRWVYSYKPQHFVTGATQNWSTPNPLPWTGGVIRGGAAPVLVLPGDVSSRVGSPDGPYGLVYYHFFHGCLKRIEGSVYTMGCNVFEAKPPYRVLRQTVKPLMWPDLPAVGESVVKRYVLWPGGAVPHAGRWHFALGIDDTYCRISSLSFEEVEAALTDVPGDRDVASVRETAIATGVKKGAR